MPRPFVPDDFVPPTEFESGGFRLEPLGRQHNQRDHEAWMSSIEWIRSTPGYGQDADWPAPMSLGANLNDLEMHARDFEQGTGFTYSVLDGDDVIGCVYIYPTDNPEHGASIRSWVRQSRQELDIPLYRAVTAWIERSWPFGSFAYSPRPTP